MFDFEKYLKNIKKKFDWTQYWYYKSIIKWSWLDFNEVRKYEYWDDTRHINWKQSAKYNELYVNMYVVDKNIEVDIFVDINQNFNAWVIEKNKNLVYFEILKILKISKINNLKIIWYYFEKKWVLNNYFIWTNIDNWYNFIKKIDDILNNISIFKWYYSNLDNFINNHLNKTKKHILIVFSDFLTIEDSIINKINFLKQKNYILLFNINVPNVLWKNFNCFFLNTQNESNLDMITLW